MREYSQHHAILAPDDCDKMLDLNYNLTVHLTG